MTHILGNTLYLSLIALRACVAVAASAAVIALDAVDWAAGETHWRLR